MDRMMITSEEQVFRIKSAPVPFYYQESDTECPGIELLSHRKKPWLNCGTFIPNILTPHKQGVAMRTLFYFSFFFFLPLFQFQTNKCFLYCCFSGLDPSFSILKTKPLHFGSWLCSRLHLKLPVLLGLIEGANFNPGICWTQQNRQFYVKTGTEPAPKK
jgi:hypothetical protein